jgi:prepilin-type N-terminal cleavage/methylation domain-containing protein
MKTPIAVRPGKPARGMTLIELLIALALVSFLVLGLVQIVTAASAAGNLQLNQAQVLDRARFAIGILGRAVRQAGYRPEPWNSAYAFDALGNGNLDGASASGDRLELQTWSDLNCFDNRNPDPDAGGQPRFYLRESVFDLSADGSLTHTCRYGPAPDRLTTQIPRQGLLPGVEAFQVLYGEDADSDGNIDGWVRASQWTDARRVLGVRIGLLLASDDGVAEPVSETFDVLGTPLQAPADGRLWRLFDFALAIRNRAG